MTRGSYALSKVLGEEMARQFSRWTGIPHIGLRFSNIMEPGRLRAVPGFWDDATLREWNLWGYVDARDVAQACRLALDAELTGAEVFIVAAADTVMNRPSLELLAEVYPDVPVQDGVGEFARCCRSTRRGSCSATRRNTPGATTSKARSVPV